MTVIQWTALSISRLDAGCALLVVGEELRPWASAAHTNNYPLILSVGVRSSIFFYLLATFDLGWRSAPTNFSNTPFACALTCSSTTTICGVKKSDSLREDPCALLTLGAIGTCQTI